MPDYQDDPLCWSQRMAEYVTHNYATLVQGLFELKALKKQEVQKGHSNLLFSS